MHIHLSRIEPLVELLKQLITPFSEQIHYFGHIQVPLTIEKPGLQWQLKCY